MPSTRWHEWTDQELDYLSCIKNHTDLSYQQIAEIMNANLHLDLTCDIVRYKCNLLKGTLAPSQLVRRVSDLHTAPAWTIFRNLPKSDPQVQQILQHFGINDSTSRKTVPGRTRRRPYQGATAPATSSRNRTRRTRHATRQATAAAAAAAAQIEETSSDAEGESVSEAGPSSGGTLYLPVNPSPNLSPTPGAPDADPYGWCAWEIDYLCVLHIFARLLPAQIAEILNFLFPVNPSGEDVNQKINELCVEEHGVWEYWGAKTNHDSQVEQILTVCGFDCTSVEQSGSEAQD